MQPLLASITQLYNNAPLSLLVVRVPFASSIRFNAIGQVSQSLPANSYPKRYRRNLSAFAMRSVRENVRQRCLAAVQHVRNEQWGSAVQAFLEALAAQPERGNNAHSQLSAPFIDDLCLALSNFCAQLPPPQALWIAAKVCEHCADCKVHHLYSKLLCENGQAHKAVQVLQQHIQHINSGTNALVLESSENAKNLCVDRWHFRMLNDKARNEAYDQAIRAAIQRLGVGCTGERNPTRI